MGIPFLAGYIKKKGYKGVVRSGVPNYVSSFLLDFNGIIHNVAQIVYAYGAGENPARQKLLEKSDPKVVEAEFFQALATKMSQILFQVRPQETLLIAVDGVAPQAKMAQQRQRRFKSAMGNVGKQLFNSSAITPGTDFMFRLDDFIQRWLASASKMLPPKTIYSSHMVEGEGESKILSLIRSGEVKGDGAHVMYGMDADLIMLSMLAPIDKIFLMREDIQDVIDIDNLKFAINQHLKTPTAINDYVVMMFLVGNDFLPHMVAIENLYQSIDVLMDTYTKTTLPLTDFKNKDINWQGIVEYISLLAKEEPALLEHESKRNVKHPSRMMELATTKTQRKRNKITIDSKFDINVFRSAWYQNEFSLKGNSEIFQKLLPKVNLGVSNQKIVKMINSYLVGIHWVYRYYTWGMDHINTNWVYRYHHAPLLIDIALVAAQMKGVDGYKRDDTSIIVNPIHQLLTVLPIKSKELLPKEIKHLMTKTSPIADLYPETAVIELDGKNFDWQGIALISFVEMDRVIKAVEDTTLFSEERAQQYAPANNIVLMKTPDQIAMDKKTQQFKQFLNQKKQNNYRGNKGKGRGYKGKNFNKNYRGNKGRGGNNYNINKN